jgi:hypothetical protein
VIPYKKIFEELEKRRIRYLVAGGFAEPAGLRIFSMRKNSKTRKTKDWGRVPLLNPEQLIQWLEGMRKFTFEVWRNNPNTIPKERKTILKEWLRRTT